ncbi:hypothetical protein SESBI_01284 [Sesbania bispinosa]|nr:hypothetical protein SESBI_01284 [Sesbania bispinosa]
MDFREVPNLEKLDLEGCISLVRMDASIGTLSVDIQAAIEIERVSIMEERIMCILSSTRIQNIMLYIASEKGVS